MPKERRLNVVWKGKGYIFNERYELYKYGEM